MPSWPQSQSIDLSATSALTANYGDGSAGWLSEEINCHNLNDVLIELDVTKGDATSLSLKVLTGNPGAEVADLATMQKIDGSGALSDLIMSKALTADAKFVFRVRTAALSMIRLAAKVDVATGDPAATARKVGSF